MKVLRRATLAAIGIATLACPVIGANAQRLTVQSSAPASPGALVDATNPQLIAEIMKSEGYEAKLSQQDSGASEIQSNVAGTHFWIYFQACDPDFTNCEVITFAAGFDFDTPQVSGVLGNWNQTRYSKAYLDSQGDPFVEFSVNMAQGVSRENFVNTLDWFASETVAFMQQVGWHEDTADPARPI